MPGEPPAAHLPRWLEVSLSAPEPPVLGEPFTVQATVTAVAAALPEARFRWKLPRGARILAGKESGKLTLEKEVRLELSWKLVFQAPLSIVEGQMALDVSARLPRRALFAATRSLAPAQAAAVEAEIRARGDAPQTVSAGLEVAVTAREGFVGFTPLVWSAYLPADGFYVGAGSFMDTNFSAQDLVADAERRLLAGDTKQAAALLERARVDLAPHVEADALLRWEALNCEAICQFLDGDREKARQAWQSALEEPAFAEVRRYALYNLGEASLRAGARDEARRYFEQASAARPAFRLPAQKLRLLRKGK
jgi:tetratricopeptide (TPR) repeat protein